MINRRWGLGATAAVATVLLIVLVQHWRAARRLQQDVDQAVADFGGSIGHDRGGRLTANLGTSAITDKEIALLAPLTALRMVDLRFSQISDAGLAALSNLTGVTDLNLDHTRIDGSGLAHLTDLSSLEGLEISHTRLDDQALAHLRPFTNLRRLDLTGTKVTAAGVVQLKALKNLEYLAVSFELIKEAEAALKTDLPRLQVQDDQFDMPGGPTWTANAGFPQLRNAKGLTPPVRVVQSAPLSDGGTFTVWLQGANGAVLTVCISCPDFFAHKRLPTHVYQGGVAAGDPGARLVPSTGLEHDSLIDALIDVLSQPIPESDGIVNTAADYWAARSILNKLCEDCKGTEKPCPDLPPPRQKIPVEPDDEVVPGPTITNSIGMELVLIPAGEFRMGSPVWERYRDNYERWHFVHITRPFYIGKYEVTLGEFLAFNEDPDNPSRWTYEKQELDGNDRIVEKDGKYQNSSAGEPGPANWGHPTQTPRHPVVDVNWFDAVAFCEWLSLKERRRYRLPTEAEWEYACRAGAKTAYYNGKDPDRLAQIGNVADAAMREHYNHNHFNNNHGTPENDGYPFTAPVGQFLPNCFGLYDMAGNVAEWCSDWYETYYYQGAPTDDPEGPSSGSYRVARGGKWRYDPHKICRSADRFYAKPAWRDCDTGFRVVCEQEESGESPAPPGGKE